MRWFVIDFDSNNYSGVLPVGGQFDAIDALCSRSPIVDWTPLRLETCLTRRGRRMLPLADICAVGATFAIGERAREVLWPVLSLSAELLPCTGVAYSIVHVVRAVDALDEERSHIERFASSGRIMLVRHHVLRGAAIPAGIDVFVLSAMRAGRVVVSERFVERVQAAGLLGARFEEVDVK